LGLFDVDIYRRVAAVHPSRDFRPRPAPDKQAPIIAYIKRSPSFREKMELKTAPVQNAHQGRQPGGVFSRCLGAGLPGARNRLFQAGPVPILVFSNSGLTSAPRRTADPASKLWLEVGQENVVAPALRAHHHRMGAPVVPAIDQEPAQTGLAHFTQGYFLLAAHCLARAQPWRSPRQPHLNPGAGEGQLSSRIVSLRYSLRHNGSLPRPQMQPLDHDQCRPRLSIPTTRI
jgi:hypothetical protein